MKKIASLLILLISALSLKAQDRNAVSAIFLYGNKVFDENGTYKGLGLSYQFNTVNNKADWPRLLNIKNINIEAAIYDMGNITGGSSLTDYDEKMKNTHYFGSNITLTGGVDIGLIDLSAFKLMFSPGLGVVYATKTYFNTHGINQVLGCHLNAMGTARLKLLVPVTDDVFFNFGAGLSHISNSNITCPNVGLNCLDTFIGLTQYIDYPKTTSPKFSLT